MNLLGRVLTESKVHNEKMEECGLLTANGDDGPQSFRTSAHNSHRHEFRVCLKEHKYGGARASCLLFTKEDGSY